MLRSRAVAARHAANEKQRFVRDLYSRALEPGASEAHKQEIERQIAEAQRELADLEREADRLEAIAQARELIPPLQDETDLWGANARGSLRHDHTYRPDVRETSYVRDLLAISLPGYADPTFAVEASERLRRNQAEALDYLGIRRDVTTADPGGGAFIPPVYLDTQWIDAAVGGRPLADAVAKFPYPEAGKQVSFPRVATAPDTAVQAAEADAVNETDLDGDTLSVNKVTIAGQNDITIQALDWSLPGLDVVILRELVKSYNQRLDAGILYGVGSGGQHRGLKKVVTDDGGNAISFSSGGADDLLGKIYQGVSDVSTNAPGFVPNAIVLHPRRAAWISSHRDQNANLLQQGQLTLAAGTQDGGRAGSIAGLPVIIDPNIQTNQGTGTNEDDVYVLDLAEVLLAESALRTRVLQEVLSGTLQVRIQAFGYSALAASRRPATIARISGAGLASPTFPST